MRGSSIYEGKQYWEDDYSVLCMIIYVRTHYAMTCFPVRATRSLLHNWGKWCIFLKPQVGFRRPYSVQDELLPGDMEEPRFEIHSETLGKNVGTLSFMVSVRLSTLNL